MLIKYSNNKKEKIKIQNLNLEIKNPELKDENIQMKTIIKNFSLKINKSRVSIFGIRNKQKIDFKYYLGLNLKSIFCCRLTDNERELDNIYKSVSLFYDSIIDVNNLLTKIDQLEEMKKMTLSKKQYAIFRNSKIIFDYTKRLLKDNKLDYAFESLKYDSQMEILIRDFEKKVNRKKISKFDKMVIKKF